MLFSFAAWDSFLCPQTCCAHCVFLEWVATCPPKNKLILCYSAMSFLRNICFSFCEWLFLLSLVILLLIIYIFIKVFCANNLFWLQWLLHSIHVLRSNMGSKHTIKHKYDTLRLAHITCTVSKQLNALLDIFFCTRVHTVSGTCIRVRSFCFCIAWCKCTLIGCS